MDKTAEGCRVKTFEFDNVTVRIHEGGLNAEQLKAVLEDAAKRFWPAIRQNEED